MQPLSAPPVLLDVGLLVTLLLIGTAVATGEPAAFKLAIAFHMWLRIYDGRFLGWRKATWLLLVLFSFFLFASGFLAYVLPSGQMSFWLAAKLGPAGRRIAASLRDPGPVSWGLFGLLSWAAIIADMVALHTGRAHARKVLWGTALLLVALVIAAIARDIVHLFGAAPMPSAPTASANALQAPQHIIPSLDMLWVYAILRAVPSKTLGVTLVAVALLLPIAAAWTRGWRFHGPRTRIAWIALSAAWGASWIGLTWIGAQPPSEGPQWDTLALLAYQVAYFLVGPPLLARRLRPETAAAAIFE